MSALVCDICGGKLSMGSGGIAICQSCGMEHAKSRMQEKIQEIKGTVKVDNTHMVNNYLNLARNAYDVNNLVEAESYSNRIIEIDPNNYQAWFIKAVAAGWQSTLTNPRIVESVNAFSNSISNAPKEEKESLINQSSKDIKEIAASIAELRGKRFMEWIDFDDVHDFENDVSMIMNAIELYKSKISDFIISLNILEHVANRIEDFVFALVYGNSLDFDYEDGQEAFLEYINKTNNCIEILLIANSITNEHEEGKISRYGLLVTIHERVLGYGDWSEVKERHANSDDYVSIKMNSYFEEMERRFSLPKSMEKERRELIKHYKLEIKKLEEIIENKKDKEVEAKRELYWKNHQTEKLELEEKLKNLNNQIKEGNNKIENIESNKEIRDLKEKLESLRDSYDFLGIFKRNEKRKIQDEINTVKNNLEILLKDNRNSIELIKEKLIKLKDELNYVQTELTKER